MSTRRGLFLLLIWPLAVTGHHWFWRPLPPPIRDIWSPRSVVASVTSGASNRFWDADGALTQHCGVTPATTRIVGGQESKQGSWPWAAVLGLPAPDGSGKFSPACIATLVTSRHVLTAAHCVQMARFTHVRLGEHDLDSSDDGANPLDIPIEEAVMHHGWSEVGIHDDIALLKLREPVDFSARPDIAPICPPGAGTVGRVLDGQIATVLGWGATRSNWYSPVLREAKVDMADHSVCTFALARTLADKKVQLTELIEVLRNRDGRQVCAGTGTSNVCFGDSGGPLMMQNPDGTWGLIGVTSYSPGGKCGVPGVPSLFTRIDKYMRWIKQNLRYQYECAFCD